MSNTSDSKPLRVAVIGVGHLGNYHAQHLAAMDGVELAAVVDTRAGQADRVAAENDTHSYTDFRKVLRKIDAAVVAVPTITHHSVAKRLLKAGIPVLVEKPLAATRSQARALVRAARKTDTLLQVGHIERFNPVISVLKDFTVRPKFIEAHRLASYSFRSTDIGVVFDLMVHDIDIILQMVDAPLKRVDAVGVSVLGRNEDIANARLTFTNGCVANVTASRISLHAMRKMRIWSPNAYVSLDFGSHQGQIIRPSEKLRHEGIDLDAVRPEDIPGLKAKLFTEYINIRNIHIEEHDALGKELECFVDSVRHGRAPVVSGEEALAAIEVAHKVVDRINRYRWEGDSSGFIGPLAPPPA